jgi:glyoxylase-like metal-dependent hydrolase (beta-lactamase superfamily II)
MLDPQPDFQPVPGQADLLEPGLRRILAPNPSPMTYRGTNTYVLGQDSFAVIAPGPDLPAHMDAIMAATPGRISHILVTHAHVDHSPLARPLAQATGAQVYAFGDAQSGRSDLMRQLAASGQLAGGEGVDSDFAPDVKLQDGDEISGDGWSLRALHTPGHMGNHLCFAMNDLLFCGDLVMGWASSLVSPPDGDLSAFMASCRSLTQQDWRVFHSGHGAPIANPNERLHELIAHREMREVEIMQALRHGPASPSQLTAQIYAQTPPALHPAAQRNVLAHIIDLYERNLLCPIGDFTADAVFELR